MLAAYGAYMEAMADAGREQAPASALRPTSTATTVRVKNGKTQVLNGPYAEVKEQFGGYYPHRRARSRRGDLMGGALPRRAARRHRSAADLGDVGASRRGGTETWLALRSSSSLHNGPISPPDA